MPWTSPSTRASGYKVTATNWNELVNNLLFLEEIAYVEFTADVSVTATTVGTANQIVSAGAISYEAAPTYIEFYCPRVNSAAMVNNLILRDTTTVLGTIAWFPVSAEPGAVHAVRRFTPSAASHTYNIASWNASAGTWTYNAGTGGAAGDSTTSLPGFIRVYRIPT